MATARCGILPAVAILASAANASGPNVFVAGQGSTVSIFDSGSLQENASIAYPGLPVGTVFTADGSTAYVAAGKIFETNALGRSAGGALPSNHPRILQISTDGGRLFAANADRSISVYDLDTGTVTARIPFAVHDAPFYSATGLAVSNEGSLIVLKMFSTAWPRP